MKDSRRIQKYWVVIEKAAGTYSAYVPDLPGCVSVGNTVAETEQSIRQAIEFHIRCTHEDGGEVPARSVVVKEIEVSG